MLRRLTSRAPFAPGAVRCLAALLLGLLAVAALNPVRAEDAAAVETFQLGLIHTNDSHGHIQPYKVDGQPDWGGMARRRVAIQQARADADYNWLVLDAGDVFQGTALSNLLTGFLDLECMNQIGYDVMCPGNHEFDFGYELFQDRMSHINFAVTCCNVLDKQSGEPIAAPFVIFTRGGYRVGVIGATTETLYGETDPSIRHFVDVLPAIEAVRPLAQYLRTAGCDIVIALTHQGYNRDLAMAAAIPELDAIVGGHSHTFLEEPARVGDVVVTQAGSYGQLLGVLRLRFERAAGERFRLASYDNSYEPLSPDAPVDTGMARFIAAFSTKFDIEMNRVVCEAAMDLPNELIRVQECALGNLCADALRSVVGADAALFNGGNFRSGLNAGPVTFADLYGVMPYDNFLLKLTLSGARLREVLEAGGAQYGQGGFPHVSGMRLRYLDGRLAEASIGGAPLDDAASYTLLTTDFVGSGGDGYPFSEDPYGPGLTGLEQRASFAKWAAEQKVLSAGTDGRVVFDWTGEPPLVGK